MRLPNLDHFVAPLQCHAWKWVKCTHALSQHLCRLCPIDGRFCLFNFVRVSDALKRLLHRFEVAHLRESRHNHSRPHLGQGVVQTGRGVLGADRATFFKQHVTRVQSRIHLHDGHSGLSIAGLNRTVDGRSTSPSGQQ